MANYVNLRNAIRNVIKANGNNEITGQILQEQLLAMITELGAGYQYMGIAQPSTNPGQPDSRVFYIAYSHGNYPYFNQISVDRLCILKYSTQWTKDDLDIGSGVGFVAQPDDLTLDLSTPQKLKFANRFVGNNIDSGLNYVILREDMTFAEQVLNRDTIYEIRYDFDLNNVTVNVPANCVLKFNGGKIEGGNIIFNDTLLIGNVDIARDVTASGTVLNEFVTPKMFGAKGDNSTNDTKAFENAVAVCDHIIVPNGDYLVDAGSKSLGYGIRIMRSGVTFEMENDAVLYAQNLPASNQGNQFRNVITIEGPGVQDDTVQKIENVTIRGGKIVGGRSNFVLPASGLTTETRLENYCGIAARYCDNLRIENIIITDNTGDAVYFGGCNNSVFIDITSKRNRRAAISVGYSVNTHIDRLNSEQDCQYVSYSNGNSSYGTEPNAIICTEPEPHAMDDYFTGTIKDVFITNCTFNMGAAEYAFLGCGENIHIENNYFFNVDWSWTIIDVTGSSDSHYNVGDFFIKNNRVEISPTYSRQNTRYFVWYNGVLSGSSFIEGNSITGFMVAKARNAIFVSVTNNYIKHYECADVTYHSDMRGFVFEGNKGTFTRAVHVDETGVGGQNSYLIIKDNQTDGSTNRVAGVNAFVTKNNVSVVPYVYVIGNRVTLSCPFIISMSYQQTDKVIMKDNDIFMTNPSDLYFFDMNGNLRYVDITMINNHIRTARNTKLVVGDPSVVMKVLNNVFSGAETAFTAEETDSANLVFKNNYYLG